MINKKGFQLSINMLVVIILGLVMLFAGITMFYNAFNKTIEMSSEVDAQTQRQLDVLLNSGETVSIGFASKEGSRGDYVDFALGINNELGDEYYFKVEVEFHYLSTDPTYDELCVAGDTQCGPLYNKEPFTLLNNEHKYAPIRIIMPKKDVSKGQYFFNVDVCAEKDSAPSSCDEDNKYGTRQVISVLIK